MKLNMTSRILESVQATNEDTRVKSYKVLKEENVIKESLSTCPRCGKEIIGYPAVSRFDNETEICSDCGMDEAFENMAGYMTDPNTGERMSLDDLKNQRRAELEDRAGELRVAMDDGALADDEIEAVKKEVSELEDNLNEGAYLDNRDMLVKHFNEAWSEAKFLQAEMRFTKPNISKLRESIPIICDNLDKLGELLKIVDDSESASINESSSEDTLKESSNERSELAKEFDIFLNYYREGQNNHPVGASVYYPLISKVYHQTNIVTCVSEENIPNFIFFVDYVLNKILSDNPTGEEVYDMIVHIFEVFENMGPEKDDMDASEFVKYV